MCSRGMPPPPPSSGAGSRDDSRRVSGGMPSGGGGGARRERVDHVTRPRRHDHGAGRAGVRRGAADRRRHEFDDDDVHAVLDMLDQGDGHRNVSQMARDLAKQRPAHTYYSWQSFLQKNMYLRMNLVRRAAERRSAGGAGSGGGGGGAVRGGASALPLRTRASPPWADVSTSAALSPSPSLESLEAMDAGDTDAASGAASWYAAAADAADDDGAMDGAAPGAAEHMAHGARDGAPAAAADSAEDEGPRAPREGAPGLGMPDAASPADAWADASRMSTDARAVEALLASDSEEEEMDEEDLRQLEEAVLGEARDAADGAAAPSAAPSEAPSEAPPPAASRRDVLFMEHGAAAATTAAPRRSMTPPPTRRAARHAFTMAHTHLLIDALVDVLRQTYDDAAALSLADAAATAVPDDVWAALGARDATHPPRAWQGLYQREAPTLWQAALDRLALQAMRGDELEPRDTAVRAAPGAAAAHATPTRARAADMHTPPSQVAVHSTPRTVRIGQRAGHHDSKAEARAAGVMPPNSSSPPGAVTPGAADESGTAAVRAVVTDAAEARMSPSAMRAAAQAADDVHGPPAAYSPPPPSRAALEMARAQYEARVWELCADMGLERPAQLSPFMVAAGGDVGACRVLLQRYYDRLGARYELDRAALIELVAAHRGDVPQLLKMLDIQQRMRRRHARDVSTTL